MTSVTLIYTSMPRSAISKRSDVVRLLGEAKMLRDESLEFVVSGSLFGFQYSVTQGEFGQPFGVLGRLFDLGRSRRFRFDC